MKLCAGFGFVFLSLLCLSTLSPASSAAASSPSTNISTCPMDLNYVLRIPWNTSLCQNFQSNETKKTLCCQTIISLYGVALARRLKETSLFQLPDLPTSISCLQDFQSKLTSLSLQTNLVSSCFTPQQFVISPNSCAHIQSTQDWVSKLGSTTALNSGCRSNLTNLTSCDACVAAGLQVQRQLIVIDGNASHATNCLFFTVLYAAGIVNEFGAESGGAVSCIVGLAQLESQVFILHKKSDLLGLKIGLGVGIPAATLLILFGVVLYLVKRRRRSAEEEANNLYLGKLRWLPGMPREFKFKDLNKATNNFHESMKLGKGGFGTVYKGILHDKDQKSTTQIAVKKFSRENIKGKDDFFAELTIIHRLRHKHLVRLVGWCYKKRKLLLVYDFMPNGSVDKHLYGAGASEQNTLTWERRHRILAGVASSLHYLHNEYDQKVVHRDLKASNILLDSDYNARLGDFGLARALDNERNSYTEQGLIAGTIGYLAPECFHTGRATTESDVYGFGAVVLEVVCGKSPVTRIHQQEDLYALVDWVWMLHREGRIEEAVDERLDSDYEVDEAKRLLVLGLACSHPIASERPQAHAICQIIAGNMPAPSVPPFKPAFTFIWPSVAPTFSTTGSTTFSTTNSIHSNIAEGFCSCPNLGVRAPSIVIVSNTASS